MPLPCRPISDFDAKVLADRGVSLETARRNRLRTAAGALEIPYMDLSTGGYGDYALRRPHKPPTRDGKPVKYLAPTGQPSRPYCPAECRESLLDAREPLLITEGPLKALALAQAGFVSLALQGVWNWKVAGTDELLPTLAAVPLAGRTVYVVFDFDKKPETQKQVAEARRRLARALIKGGARDVRNVVLPPAEGGEKQGVDDFLAAHGADALTELVEQAELVNPANAPLTKPEGLTDTANAARFVTRHGDCVRWVGPWDKYLIWDGRRWKVDQHLAIDLCAKDIAADMFAEVAALAKAKIGPDALNAILRHCKYSNSASGLQNMLRVAKSELAIGPDALDRNAWVLNVENGTLDLRSGELHAHRREEFLTKLVPVTFDPDATCPVWEQFVRTIFADDEELIAYVQRLAGYCLTGDTSEHILPFLYGTGANGKSTLCETMLKLLGSDYSMKAAPDLLMARRGEGHPTDRADLFGKRFVACVETEEGRRMAESLAKELTGGDRVRARRMREDFWEFVPTHHVWLAGNHKPKITGTDKGIWRRIKLIPFDVTITDDKQDKQLGAKLAAELPGILNWALAGCLDWQRDGMCEPDAVKMKTTEYSTEMDEVGQFVDESCEINPQFVAPATDLFREFQRTTDSKITQHSFGTRLTQMGYERCRTNKGKHGWRGLRLRSAGDTAAVAAQLRAKFPGSVK